MAQAMVQESDASRASPGTYTLVHVVGASRAPLFQPMRLMNPVTYLGRINGNDVVLASDNVSRRHAKLIVGADGVTVHDLDSHNGIFLNGKKVRSTPLADGDLLYVGDVCIQLQKDHGADAAQAAVGTRVMHTEITGEEDPAVRNLATLLRATQILMGADHEAARVEIVELCRELTEATVAVFVTRSSSGQLETPVVLQPENGARGNAPISAAVAHKVLEDGLGLFTTDARNKPPVPDADADGALMCVPLLSSGHTDAALYLARPAGGPVFTEREMETVAAILQMLALHRRPAAPPTHGEGDDAVSLAAQAKVEAAEERLREAQNDARQLTDRIHTLEAENLKVRQQVDIEKQNGLEAKREAERARAEASKLDKGLHKTDEEAKKAKDAIHRLEEERGKLRENVRTLDDERKARTADVERLKESQRALEAERQRLDAEIDTLRRESTDAASQIMRLQTELSGAAEDAARTRASLEGEMGVLASQKEALKAAMRQTLPPSVAEHVEHSLDGAPLLTDAVPRQVAALHLELFGIDSWAAKASPLEVKARLDRFCATVGSRARANGGRIEQVLGHAHLVTFAADPPSVRAAIRCGLEVASILKDEGVVASLHVGTVVSGFFGEGESATRIEVGEAPGVARALAQLAHAPTFYASDAVQRAVAGDPSFQMAIIGPARTQHGPTMLFTVEAAEGGGPA